MDRETEYLLSYLEDEFKDHPHVRIRSKQAAGIQRSPDLVQDYDPESNDLHRQKGVVVQVQSREFYFPADWVSAGQFDKVKEQATEIHHHLE